MSDMIIRRTANLLVTQSDDLIFDAEDLILYRTRSFSKKTQHHLTNLVRRAQQLAFQNCTANVLVGASNKGSETGDVGLWLGHGDYGKGKEGNILRALGLPESWLISLKEAELTQELETETPMMMNRYCFFVEVDSPAYVFFFYIGQFDDGWGGLVAAGRGSLRGNLDL